MAVRLCHRGGSCALHPTPHTNVWSWRLLTRALESRPESHQKIFSLYYTTKPNGTGVGLAMTFRIIQLHNGSIEFSSELNRGTTFHVSLPRM